MPDNKMPDIVFEDQLGYIEKYEKDKKKIVDCARCGRKKETFKDYDEFLNHVLNC